MYTKFYPRVRSKNYSIEGIRKSAKGLPALPVRSVIRFGSLTPTEKVFKRAHDNIVEINTTKAIEISRSKLLMKEAFLTAEIPQSDWWTYYGTPNGGRLFLSKGVPDEDSRGIQHRDLPYPILAKRVYGFKGRGMEKFDTKEGLETWLNKHSNTSDWYFEKFHNYSREYRLHCTKEGCFYSCRKMLKEEAEDRWYRNDSNCIWALPTNPDFDQPSNWKSIEEDCVKALNAVGLDVGAFDVRVQSSKNKIPAYIIIEVNSAPAFGLVTEQEYKKVLPELIINKAKTLKLL